MVLFILYLLAGLFVVINGYAQDVNSGFLSLYRYKC